jgi:hypothetical protein
LAYRKQALPSRLHSNANRPHLDWAEEKKEAQSRPYTMHERRGQPQNKSGAPDSRRPFASCYLLSDRG